MPLQGAIRVPSDKSISHRTVLFSGLAHGVSHVQDVLPSADVLASIDAMRALGAHIKLEEGDCGLTGTIEGFGQQACGGPFEIDCGNSGTTARLLMGVLSGLNVEARLTGDASLSSRPMMRVIEPLLQLGALIEASDGCLPARVRVHDGLQPAHIRTKQASAQVKSAVLLAGLFAQGTTSVTEPKASRNHTELMLPAYGARVETSGLTSCVEGPARLTAHDIRVPGDPSSAAFIAVAAALMQSSAVTIEQVALNPTRTGAFEVLRRMGCAIEYSKQGAIGAEPVGDIVVRFSPRLDAAVVEPEEIPTLIDEIPVLALAAACAHGETVFKEAGELRVKESDRLSAILDMLECLGVHAFAQGDDLHIVGAAGVPRHAQAHVEAQTHHDHRLAMTWHIAGLCFGVDVSLDDADCVAVSWPGFFDAIESL